MTEEINRPRWIALLPSWICRRIEGRPVLHQILGNAGWLVFDKIVRMGVGLLVGVWVARYLGAAQFGVLSYAMALVAIYGQVAALGLDGILVRDCVNGPEARNELLATAFFMKLAGAVVLILFASATVILLRPGETMVLSIVAVISIGALFQTADVCDFWFQSQLQSRYSAFARTAAFLLLAVVKVILILNHMPLIAFAWVATGEAALAASFLWWAYAQSSGKLVVNRASATCARRLLRESWPLLLAGMAVSLYMRVDLLMLSAMVGDKEAGIYAAATRISEIWYFIPLMIAASIFPVILKSRQSDHALYIRRLRSLYRLLSWLAIAIALPLSLLSTWIVAVLYGDGYAESAPVLMIHLWASVAVFLGVGSSQYLLAENLQRISMYRTAAGLICNVALNFVFIPQFGAKGAAIATVISYFVATFSLVFFKSTRAHAVHLIGAPFSRV